MTGCRELGNRGQTLLGNANKPEADPIKTLGEI